MSGSFVFDVNRCTGCGACRVACTIENGLAPDVSWRRVETFNPRRLSTAPVFHLSLACNHCRTAACMHACPALACRRDDETGAVLIDADSCIGCGYCSWACPYDAPVFDETAGVMTKCTWCADRLRAGLKPACAAHCPTGALDYAVTPPRAPAQAIEGLPVTALQPNLHVIALRPGRVGPEMADVSTDVLVPSVPSASGIGLRREWPLAVFTLGSALLVAIVIAAAWGRLAPNRWAFALSAAAILAIANRHLGRKARAWRAALNVRTSWLSREVVLLSAFAAGATGWLFVAPGDHRIGWVVAAIGLAGVFAADRLYGVLPGRSALFDSAGVTWTALMMAGAFGVDVRIAGILAGAKVASYARRLHRGESRVPRAVAAARVVASIAGAWLIPVAYWPAALLLVAGEVIDRGEYYQRLTRRTPRAEMDQALADRLRDRPREVRRGAALARA